MRIVDFIVADDVREEVGGKTSVMGIYNSVMRLQRSLSFPYPLRLALFLRLERDAMDPEAFDVSLDVSWSDGSQADAHLATLKANVKASGQLVGLPFVLFPLKLDGPGRLGFDVKVVVDDSPLLSERRVLNIALE